MDEKICQNCKHFYQHYTLDEKKILRVYCGHCGFRKVIRKRPDTCACEYFAQVESKEKAFVSKEYLSKELLRHLLQMDLLPEIGEVDVDRK